MMMMMIMRTMRMLELSLPDVDGVLVPETHGEGCPAAHEAPEGEIVPGWTLQTGVGGAHQVLGLLLACNIGHGSTAGRPRKRLRIESVIIKMRIEEFQRKYKMIMLSH